METCRIDISISEQTLVHRSGTGLVNYPVSTALNGCDQRKNSLCTPLGEHYVRARIGDQQPVNSVFVGRRASGEIYSEALAAQHPGRDWILTRILWLCGKQVGFNRLGDVDSMQRYIYIHGTPDSEPMGVPRSHGCIRMRNSDMIQLFESTPYGTPVFISAE